MQHPDGTEVGYRNCFEAPEGWLMCSADFSGQELNVMAAMSRDPVMLKTLNDGGDLHSEAAAAMFNVPLSDVKNPKPGDAKGATYRDYGKVVNFSLAYGKTAAGFAADWKIDKKEAEAIIDKFEKRFAVLSAWLKGHGDLGVLQGYSRLDFGPIRFVGEAKRADKDAPKRAAMNYQIQGLSSWMSRLAMINLDKAILQDKLPIKLTAMIHDEILCIFKPDTECKTYQVLAVKGSKEDEKQAREVCGEGCCAGCTVTLEGHIGKAMADAGNYFLQGRVPAGYSIGTAKDWKH